jgi:hypothetical protein
MIFCASLATQTQITHLTKNLHYLAKVIFDIRFNH